MMDVASWLVLFFIFCIAADYISDSCNAAVGFSLYLSFVQNMMLYFIPASIGLYRCWRSMGRPMICLCSVRSVPCIQAENCSSIF